MKKTIDNLIELAKQYRSFSQETKGWSIEYYYEKDHGYYDNRGRNVNNCPWVCHKDGCNMWAYCDLRT